MPDETDSTPTGSLTGGPLPCTCSNSGSSRYCGDDYCENRFDMRGLFDQMLQTDFSSLSDNIRIEQQVEDILRQYDQLNGNVRIVVPGNVANIPGYRYASSTIPLSNLRSGTPVNIGQDVAPTAQQRSAQNVRQPAVQVAQQRRGLLNVVGRFLGFA